MSGKPELEGEVFYPTPEVVAQVEACIHLGPLHNPPNLVGIRLAEQLLPNLPQVAVFGSSSPDHTPPLNDKARVVWLRVDPKYQPPLACAPCYERTCPLGHTRCLEDVQAERVYALL